MTPQHPQGWIVAGTYRHGNSTITAATEISISGERGRFRFVRHVIKGDTEWIDVVGLGPHQTMRSFRPDRITRVHRVKKGDQT
jgi:hypothetical protein